MGFGIPQNMKLDITLQIYQSFVFFLNEIRGRRLKFSMANWKNRRPSFDLLRKVIQGRSSLRWLLVLSRGGPKREIGARVLGTWRNRHPGSVLIPAQFLRFHSSSTTLPTRFFRTKCWVVELKCVCLPEIESGLEEICWRCGGTEMESEELCWYPIGTRVLFLHVPPTLTLNFIFHRTFLGVQNWPKNCWPWMTFLSRSNKHGPYFHFATEYIML